MVPPLKCFRTYSDPSSHLLSPRQPKDHPSSQSIGPWEPKNLYSIKSSKRWYLAPILPGLYAELTIFITGNTEMAIINHCFTQYIIT